MQVWVEAVKSWRYHWAGGSTGSMLSTAQLSAHVLLSRVGGVARYRARRKQREAAAEGAVEQLRQRLAELQAHNWELDARERLMTQLVEAQELHIDRLSANEVSLLRSASAQHLVHMACRMSSKHNTTVECCEE